jgi:hypothetical protein
MFFFFEFLDGGLLDDMMASLGSPKWKSKFPLVSLGSGLHMMASKGLQRDNKV